jgi:hypothetical protein
LISASALPFVQGEELRENECVDEVGSGSFAKLAGGAWQIAIA